MGNKITWLGIAVMSCGLIINGNMHDAVMIGGVIILVVGVIAIIMDK